MPILSLFLSAITLLLGMWYGHSIGYRDGYKYGWKICTHTWLSKCEKYGVELSKEDYVSDQIKILV